MEDRTGRPSPFRSPALAPAVALTLGLRLGLAVTAAHAEPPWAGFLGLALLGVAWGGRGGLLLAVCAVGATVGAAAPGQTPGSFPGWVPDPDRPVVALVDVTGHWRRFEESWSAPVRVVRLRQGTGQATRVRTRVFDAWLRFRGSDAPPPLGSRLRVRGHLRRAPPLGNLPPTPPGRWQLSCKSRLLLEGVARPGPVARMASVLRRRVEEALATNGETLAPPAGRSGAVSGPSERGLALVRALVLGDASSVGLPVHQGLRRLGLAHVLAVSGLHVALVAGAASFLGAWLGRRARFASALGAMAIYLLVVGPRPSLLRASIMGCLAVTALVAERPPQAANALAVAAAGLALHRPAIVLDLGFSLTVGATAGIVLLGPILLRGPGASVGSLDEEPPESEVRDAGRWGVAGRWVARSLAASLGAQLGVLPWALPAFSLLTPWAPVANLVAVPWTALSLAVCLAWTGLACVSPSLARACSGVVDLVAAPFSWTAQVPPRPWIALPLSLGSVEAALLAGGAVLVLRRVQSKRMLLVVAGAAVVGLLGVGLAPGSGKGPVTAVAIDVGQGDAILLRDGSSAALVDGGGWRRGDLGGRVLLPVLARLGVRSLDAVVASHPDRDHCGGLVDIAGYLAVGETVTGPGVEETSCGRALRSLPGARHRTVAAGAGISVGRWQLRVLHPEARSGRSGDNDDSLVLTAEAFGRRLLLTGDIEVHGERQVARRAESGLACDLLKVAHHGSRSSSGVPFLVRARPLVALVSAGVRNPYGHPAPEVLERLAEHAVTTFRTDRDGMIVVEISPGGSMRVGLPAAPKGFGP